MKKVSELELFLYISRRTVGH